MYYDADGNMTAAGAEAEGNAIIDLAEDYGWTKVELCARFFYLIIIRSILPA
jgi:hypothetical protein